MKQLVYMLLGLVAIAAASKLTRERDLEMYREMEKFNRNDLSEMSEYDDLQDNKSNQPNFVEGPARASQRSNAFSRRFRPRSQNPKKKSKIVKRKVYKDPTKVLYDSWLKISSPIFRHPGKYPEITLPNWNQIKINVNKDDFRINEAFNPANTSGNTPPTKLYFWFRLSGKNLYYASTKDDVNVLGAIPFKNVVGSLKSGNNDPKCFKVKDKESRKWTLCAQDVKTKIQWICQIKTMLGYTKVKECDKTFQITGGEDTKKPTVITSKVTEPIIMIPLASKKCNEGWDYANKGGDWNCECSEGKEQSPINLPPRDKAIISPVKPIFEFNEVQPKQDITNAEGEHVTFKYLTIRNKHNLLKIKHQFFGKTVTLDGSIFTAEEIVFHTPAEHTIDGKRYDMEMQIVHYGKTKGDIAKQVVLSFLFKKQPGVYNKFIDDLDFFNLPNPVTKKRAILNPIHIPKIFYNSDYEETPVMKSFSFYTYTGSLTAPPCSERTIHYVASEPIPLGSSALQLFQEAIRVPDMISNTGQVIVSNIPPENNRNLQPLNGRAVFYYDKIKFCGNEDKLLGAKGRGKKKGHYEKVLKRITDYYYVNGPKPSGMPGSFVVSSKEALGEENN